jgi:PTS system cellobiose-specific IIB component
MKIVMFCAGGLSSSLLMTKMRDAAKLRNLECTIEAYGARSFQRLVGADVLLIAPQVKYLHKTYAKEVKIPYAFIDMKSYGNMNGEAVLDLALDTLNNANNPE